MSTQDAANEREDGAVLLEQRGPVAVLTLSRPAALNALTWEMYQQLAAHIAHVEEDDTVRVMIIRGDGKAFAAGTDIQQFRGYTGADGVVYEQKMEAIIEALYTLPKPVIAAVHGYAVGAGIVLSSVCDLRYAAPSARFGAPIARTLGNCLSIKNYQHLIDAFGAMRAKEMLFTGKLLSAEEALQSGFLTAIVAEEQLFAHTLEVAQQISTLAPLTIWATKQAHQRLSKVQADIPFDDVIRCVYDSHDFAEGVQAYTQKRKPVWEGR